MNVVINPFPREVADAVVDLLERWLEWRSLQGVISSIRLPDPDLVYRITGHGEVASRRFILAPCTAPRDPGRMFDFNLAFLDLEPDQQLYILAWLSRKEDPWLEGKSWSSLLSSLDMTRWQFAKLLIGALQALAGICRERRLI
ncbi:MAG: hypothetical protein C4525_03070 [Desulfarculus sp.]|jgi:hypothetical protein|nr:MAG: hypothetical protein C4525_03070 [Desulfarculus sp.]